MDDSKRKRRSSKKSTKHHNCGISWINYSTFIIFINKFLVCEFGNNRLQRFSVDGKVLQTLGGAGDDVGLFKTPWAVEIGPEGVVVADTGNNRLQRLPDMMVY